MFLARHGFGDVYNLAGGVDAWARQIDRAMATY
jgi:rhodanese-related sulfurtransferase